MAKKIIANLKEYMLRFCAPDGYGIGKVSGKSVLFSKIDTAKEFGAWTVLGDEGVMVFNGLAFVSAKMLVLPLDSNNVTQFLFPTEAGGLGLVRNCEGGVWQAWEWIEPPMCPGEEYRITEKWFGAPVYTMLFEFDGLHNTQNIVDTQFTAMQIVRYCGYIGSHCLPVIDENPDGENFAWVNATVINGTINLTFRVGASLIGNGAVIQIWYTK